MPRIEQPGIEFSILSSVKTFYRLQPSQTGYGAHPASYSNATGALSPRAKR